jgi:hypothetical protein
VKLARGSGVGGIGLCELAHSSFKKKKKKKKKNLPTPPGRLARPADLKILDKLFAFDAPWKFCT